MTTDSSNVKICVYGASSAHISNVYTDDARRLGELIGDEQWGCINGAGATGLMRAVTDGVLDHQGSVTGVIPQFMVDNGWNYSRLTTTIVTADMHERKQTMAQLATAFVALPGGCGTLEELMEIFTWIQLGVTSGKPLVVLNTNHYYDHLIAQIGHAVDEGFMRDSHRNLWLVANTPEEAIAMIKQALAQGPVKVESKYYHA